MQVWIDEPAVIESGSFHFKGWIVDDHPIDISATINGQPLSLFTYVRPDVNATYPGQHAAGFSAFVRLADIPSPGTIEIHLVSGGVSVHKHQPQVTPGALEQTAREEKARLSKREWLLPRLTCVRCRGDINPSGRCTSCGHDYDGMTMDFMPPDVLNAADVEFNGAVSRFGYDADVQRVIAQAESAGGMVLDCGAGFKPVNRPNVVTTEIFAYPYTDVLAVNQVLPFKDGVFDAVVSLHVLEHVPDPFACARELLRVLKPGGTILACTPMIVPLHGFPHHFFNPTHEGLARLFGTTTQAKNVRIYMPVSGHPINGLRMVLDVYQGALPEPARTKFLSMTMSDILAKPLEVWVGEDIATAMSEDGRFKLAANFSIEIVKERA